MIPRMTISIATLKNNTQMATATLETAQQCQQCLIKDPTSDCRWMFDDSFDDLTILSSPEDAEVEYVNFLFPLLELN